METIAKFLNGTLFGRIVGRVIGLGLVFLWLYLHG